MEPILFFLFLIEIFKPVLSIKEALLKLQDKTEYGLVLGKAKKDGAPNGTKMYPKFNFKMIEE